MQVRDCHPPLQPRTSGRGKKKQRLILEEEQFYLKWFAFQFSRPFGNDAERDFFLLLIRCCRRRLSSKGGGGGGGERDRERERVKLELQQAASTVGFFSLNAHSKRFTTEENGLFFCFV